MQANTLTRTENNVRAETSIWAQRGPLDAKCLALERMTDAQIASVLRSVPPLSRRLTYLVDVENRSYEDAAKIMGIPAERSPTTMHWLTSGCARTRSSRTSGATLVPPAVTISSFAGRG